MMVHICLCSNQMLYHWKMPLLAGNTKGSCTFLEVENIYSDNTTTIWQYTPTHVAMHNTMKAGKAGYDFTTADSFVTSEVFVGNEYRVKDGLVYVRYMCTSQELSSLHEVKPSAVLTIFCNVHIR